MVEGKDRRLSIKSYHLKDRKNGHPGSLNIVGQAMELLKGLYSERNPHDMRVFSSRTRFGAINLRKPWEKALKTANIEDMRQHEIRHMFATYASQAGASNLELACAMGHSNLIMLLRYTNLEASHIRRLSEDVSKTLVEKKGA